MSELASDYINYAKKRGENIERVMEIYDLEDTVRVGGCKGDTSVKKSRQTGHKGGTAGVRCNSVIALCVLLMCVVLMIGVTVLWVKHSNVSTEKDQLQTRYSKLNIERDQLETGYNNLKNERDQLKLQRDQCTFQRDWLQSHNDQLQQVVFELRTALSTFGLKYFNSNIYYITTVKKIWTESRQDCTNRGADLVIINSTEEQEFISKAFNGTEAWIGLTDRETEGVFKWVNNQPLTTKFWWGEEPNNFGNNEDCVITGYKSAKSNMSTWADFNCVHPVFGICEMKIFN